MSVKVMSLCYDVCFLSSCRKAVAVAIADHVDDRGEHAFPSIARLAEKTEFGERAVQYAIRDLEVAGLLVITEEGGKGARDTREWRFDMRMLKGLSEGDLEVVEKTEDELEMEGASGAPKGRIRVQQVPGRVHLTTDKGAPGAPEPSLTINNHPCASARATTDGRASPAPSEHFGMRLVLRNSDATEWHAWIMWCEMNIGDRFARAFDNESAMIVHGPRPSRMYEPPTLTDPASNLYATLKAEREERLGKAVKGLTAKSKAMTGEAA